MVSAFILVNSGIGVAYASHRQQGLPNFYSVHSWIGIAALVMMKSNIFGGLLSVFFPNWRAAKLTKRMHRRVGITGLALAFSAAVLGLAEQQGFLVKDSGNVFDPKALIAGVLAILFICVGALVVVALGERAEDGIEGMKNTADGHAGMTSRKVTDDVDEAGFA